MTGLGQLNLEMFDAPAAARPETSVAPVAQDYVVKIAHTKAGYPILICTADRLPASVIERSQKENLPAFTGREILLMKDCDPETVAHILSVKRVFHGASVEQIIREGRQ